MKRVVDVTLSILLVILLTPLFAVVGFMVYKKMGPPILFKQVRPGLNGSPFRICKFRTMAELRDPSGSLLPDRDRITPLGKFLRATSLDELPELFNVLKGDMSLVGPRPLLMDYIGRYTPRQARRHQVKPGITGWAQINGRNAISWEEKFTLDIWYVENGTFLLDLKILCLTVIQVLKRQGIYAEENETMPEFMGSRESALRGSRAGNGKYPADQEGERQ